MAKTNVRKYTDEQLLERIKKTPGFKGFPTGRWIVGVRSNEDESNIYDDKFYVYEGDDTGLTERQKFITVLTGTTHPGLDILKGGFLRFNRKGAAVLAADRCYYDMWRYIYRTSRGHELRQVNPVTVYRDGDKDGKAEEIGTPIVGLYGINFHTNTFKWYNNVIRWTIGAWSAGCQVTNQRDKFLELLLWFKKAKANGSQKYVTYFLLNEFEV